MAHKSERPQLGATGFASVVESAIGQGPVVSDIIGRLGRFDDAKGAKGINRLLPGPELRCRFLP